MRIGHPVNPRPQNSQWSWIDGSPLGYYNWDKNNKQPDNGNGNEFCGMINSWGNSGLWNDGPCTAKRDFVCQTKVNSPHSGKTFIFRMF